MILVSQSRSIIFSRNREVSLLFIRNCLTSLKELHVAYPQDSIQEVLAKMDGHLSLPCIERDGTFLGIVSKRTIFESFQAVSEKTSYADFLQFAVERCIDDSISTLHENANFEQTIEVIIRHPFVPILDGNQLIGIVKRGDVNKALSVAFATNVPSDRILLGLPEVEGVLQRLFTTTHRLGINVITAVPFDAEVPALNRRLILKVSKTDKLQELVDNLEKAGFLIIEVSK
jgi:predicted transcriptional regulator